METTHIYKIICKDENVKEFYIGSTHNLTARINNHKSNSKKSNVKLYKYIRDNGGWLNFNLIILETFDCESKNRDKESKEEEYIRTFNPTLNINHSKRSHKEYYNDNKEIILKKLKENSTEEYKKKKRLYAEKYRKENQDKVKVNNEKNKEKMVCECGSKFRKVDIKAHLKSKKHTNYLLTLNS